MQADQQSTHSPATPGPQARRLGRAFLLVALAWLLAVAVTWAYVAQQIVGSQRRAIVRAEHDTRDLAALLHAQITGELEAADDLLRLLANAARGSVQSARGLLTDLRADGNPYDRISLTDAQGRVLASTAGGFEGTSIATSDHFLRAKEGAARNVLVAGKPARTAARKSLSIPLARAWGVPGAGPWGIVEALLSPDHLARHFASVQLGARGVVLVADLDGVAYAWRDDQRAEDAGDAGTLRNGVLPRARGAAWDSFVEYDEAHDLARVISYRVLQRHQLVVVVGKSADDVFEEHSRLRRNWHYSGVVISALLSMVGLFAVVFLRQELRSATALANAFAAEHANARTDSLTGLPNRRAFQDILVAQIEYHRRHHQPLSIAYCDCDHFKLVNDRLGHEAGDRCLIDIGAALAQGLRRSDYACRIGGDEFAALFPSTRSEAAAMVMERVRAKIAQQLSARGLPVTISVGVIEVTDLDTRPETLLTQADSVMYQAKRAGGNRVVAMPLARPRRSTQPGA